MLTSSFSQRGSSTPAATLSREDTGSDSGGLRKLAATREVAGAASREVSAEHTMLSESALRCAGQNRTADAPTPTASAAAAAAAGDADVEGLLTSLGLAAYIPAFRDEEVSRALLPRLKESQLEKLIPKARAALQIDSTSRYLHLRSARTSQRAAGLDRSAEV